MCAFTSRFSHFWNKDCKLSKGGLFCFPFPVSFETHTQKYNLELTAHILKVGEARPPWNFHHLGCLLRWRGFLLIHLTLDQLYLSRPMNNIDHQPEKGNKLKLYFIWCTQVQYAAGAPNVLVGSGTGEVGSFLISKCLQRILVQVQFYQRNHRDRLLAKKQER